MKPDTFYFPHDYHSHLDPKCSALINEHGMGGYGLYWAIVEILHEQGGRIAKFPKLFDGLAYQLKVDKEILVKQIEAMLHDYELLLQDDKYIWSERVLRNIAEREAKKMLRADAGKLGGINSGISRRKRSKTKQCFEANEANEAKEIKEKKRKVKETKDKGLFILPDFIPREVWSSYMAVRDSKRAAKTSYALTLVINKLVGIEKEYGNKPVDVLNQSITGGWSDVYPLKQGGNGDGRAKFTSTNEKRSILQQDTDREAERINQRWEQAKAASGTLNLSKGNTP
jgi:hypothetical protein